MGSCMNGASVTSRSTGIFCFSSERAISITLFAPCEWPTRTTGPVLPAARSRTISLSAVDQYKWPATWALMPLDLSSSARPSMPVENTPNQPRSRSTRGSPAKAGLQHSSAMAAARHLAPSSERNAWRWFCARDGTSLPRYPRPIRAIISATAPCCVTAETPLRSGWVLRQPVPRSVAPGRFFPHYRAVAVGHVNAANPYAACSNSPPRFPRNLSDPDHDSAAQGIRPRAGLFHFVGTQPTRRDSEFFSGLCAKDGDIRSVLCLGCERRFLAGDHLLGIFRIRRLPDLHPASADARIHGECAERRWVDHGARLYRAAARQRCSSPPAGVRSDRFCRSCSRHRRGAGSSDVPQACPLR